VGGNATLQIQYTADFDSPLNQTFYACADITYVLEKDFSTTIPCFNATENPSSTGSGSHPTNTNSSPSSTSSTTTGGSGGLGGGAIAGIVIGSLAGVALLVVAGLLLYRRREQKRRAELARSARERNLAWDAQHARNKPSSSSSHNSVQLQNIQS
jgi:hypothetical protein